MSAFGCKADMTLCGNPLLRSLSGVKRTCLIAAQMSAFDPKRTQIKFLLQAYSLTGTRISSCVPPSLLSRADEMID
jgi:hypothetical protein